MSVQGSEDLTNEKQVVKSDKVMADSQNGDASFPQLSLADMKQVKAQDNDCPWPPALCGDGGFWGKPLNNLNINVCTPGKRIHTVKRGVK